MLFCVPYENCSCFIIVKVELCNKSHCNVSSCDIGLEKEQQRKIRIQLRAQETLKASSAPIQTQEASAESQSRSAQKTKSKMLGYLDQMPSFRPKTNTAVPDFDKLYQAFQQKAMEKAERKDVTHCKPFRLRTSTLQPRSRSPENLLVRFDFVFVAIPFRILCLFNIRFPFS